MSAADDLQAMELGDRSAYRALLESGIAAVGNSAALNAVVDPVASRAANGSEPALELLLDLVHRLSLGRTAITKVTTNASVIEEACQATLIRVEQRIGSFTGEAAFRTWLHTVARNETLMILRRGAGPLSETAEIDEVEHPVGRMSSVIASRETIERLVSALPEPYQETLKLQLYDGLEYDQISERLGVPVGTVRSRLAKARELLRPDLDFSAKT